jgi:hypothetical protein
VDVISSADVVKARRDCWWAVSPTVEAAITAVEVPPTASSAANAIQM